MSNIIQRTHSQETQATTTEEDTDFSAASFRQSWQQAMTEQTLPLSQMWDGIDMDKASDTTPDGNKSAIVHTFEVRIAGGRAEKIY